MQVYVDVVILLNFVVDLFLLLGTNRLCGYPPQMVRVCLAAAVGGVYGGACLLPQLYFLGNILWRTVFLTLIAVIAYGFHISTVRRGVVFILLSMALGGIAVGMGQRSFWSLAAAACGICLLCALGFRGKIAARTYVPVELHYGEKRVHLTALQDTGNTLQDPVTGRPVLVIAPEAAQKLTGLTAEQLRCPVESLGVIPGLRLIPYKAVGSDSGLMLALKFPQVKIGTWQGSSLVAFAPEGLHADGAYQALTGGTV